VKLDQHFIDMKQYPQARFSHLQIRKRKKSSGTGNCPVPLLVMQSSEKKA
jgi:hypothetical protein